MKKIESMTLIALGAALIAALSPFQIPFGPIPITLLVFSVLRKLLYLSSFIFYWEQLAFLYLQEEAEDFKHFTDLQQDFFFSSLLEPWLLLL